MQETLVNSWVGKIFWRRDRLPTPVFLGSLGGSAGKESACKAGDPGFDPWVGKIPWRRERLPTPLFWPGESHGQRRLVGYSPLGCKRVRHDLATIQQMPQAEYSATYLMSTRLPESPAAFSITFVCDTHLWHHSGPRSREKNDLPCVCRKRPLPMQEGTRLSLISSSHHHLWNKQLYLNQCMQGEKKYMFKYTSKSSGETMSDCHDFWFTPI